MKAADLKQIRLFLVATLICFEKAFTGPPHWTNISKVKLKQFVARPPKHQKLFFSLFQVYQEASG